MRPGRKKRVPEAADLTGAAEEDMAETTETVTKIMFGKIPVFRGFFQIMIDGREIWFYA